MSASHAIQEYSTIWHTNPISGHTWPEHTPIQRWSVGGGFWTRACFASEEAAEREAVARDAFDKKYPFKCPRTAKERRYDRETKKFLQGK